MGGVVQRHVFLLTAFGFQTPSIGTDTVAALGSGTRAMQPANQYYDNLISPICVHRVYLKKHQARSSPRVMIEFHLVDQTIKDGDESDHPERGESLDPSSKRTYSSGGPNHRSTARLLASRPDLLSFNSLGLNSPWLMWKIL
jgi:hypothetical protein